MNIWELAKEKVKQNEEKAVRLGETLAEGEPLTEARRRNETTIIVCGMKSSGKTSMITRFLDKTDVSRASSGLEYVYARRRRGNEKQLANIWELAGGSRMASLLAIPITPHNLPVTSLVVVVDLTRPHEMKDCLQRLLGTARQHIDSAMQELSRSEPDMHARMTEEKKERLTHHQEQQICSPFPIPLAIVGSKYDEFQNRESDERRKVCKMLRFIAHHYGAMLAFYSSRLETTQAKGRLLLAHFAFSASIGRTIQSEFNKPLFLPWGSDSFSDIGPPPMEESSFSSLRTGQPVDVWWTAWDDSFPPSKNKTESATDPSLDPLFTETQIDEFVAQKRRDLDAYAKQKKERQAAEERATEMLKAQLAKKA